MLLLFCILNNSQPNTAQISFFVINMLVVIYKAENKPKVMLLIVVY